MNKFKVWYYKHFDYTVPMIQEWVMVKEVLANTLEDVFMMMQGEVWSPNGEARDLSRYKGLTHTSMSVNDYIQTPDGKFNRVEGCGFKEFDCLPLEVVSAKSFF